MRLYKNKLFILTIFLILFLQKGVGADGEFLVRTLRGSGYVTVMGTVKESAGSEAVLLLVKNTADLQMPQRDDIGYIAQTKIGDDGRFLFEFVFDGFNSGSGTNVSDYSVLVSIDGVIHNESIEEATFRQFAKIEIDSSRIGQAIAVIDNEYQLKGVPYDMILSFYSGDGKLLKIIIEEKYSGGSNTINYSYNDIPEGTKAVKAFVWEKFNNMIPISKVQSREKTKEINLLLIGNELVADTSRFLHQIAASDNVEIEFTTMYANGFRLKDHLESLNEEIYKRIENGVLAGDSSETLKDLLSSNKTFDAIIISPHNEDGESEIPYLLELIAQIKLHNQHAEILLHQNWQSYSQGITGLNRIKSSTNAFSVAAGAYTINEKTISPYGEPIRILPVGEAFYAATQKNSMFKLPYNRVTPGDIESALGLYKDENHTSYYGRYLAGAVLYQCLTGKSIINSSFNPPKVDCYTESEHAYNVLTIKEAAIQTVMEYGWNIN